MGAVDNVLGAMGSLGGVIESIMRPLVSPLVDKLDSITGDEDAVRSTADTWRSMAEKVRAIRDFEEQTATQTSRRWQGQSGDAFRTMMDTLVADLDDVAGQFDEAAGHLDEAAQLVVDNQKMIEDLIIDLIEWAAVSLAAGVLMSVVSFGASAAAGAALAASRAAMVSAKIANILVKVSEALKKFSLLLKAIKAGEKGKVVKFLVKSQVFGRGIKAATGIRPDPLGSMGIDTHGIVEDLATYG